MHGNEPLEESLRAMMHRDSAQFFIFSDCEASSMGTVDTPSAASFSLKVNFFISESLPHFLESKIPAKRFCAISNYAKRQESVLLTTRTINGSAQSALQKTFYYLSSVFL